MEKWRETGRRLLLNIVQPVPGVKYASTHMGYAEKPKKHWNLSASTITNCAFMPTDADATNMHVPVWMGSAEAQRSIDGKSAPERATFTQKHRLNRTT